MNMAELVDSVKPNTLVCLDYLVSRGTVSSDESDLVQSKVTGAGKLNHLFSLLKTKDNGWVRLLSYLREHQQSALADKLHNDADAAPGNTGEKIPKRSALEEFSLRLAQYYKLSYTGVPTMGESPKHVKDVWVPLQIDGRSENHLPTDRISHTELLSRINSAQDRNVAVIKGDPGMGKTTLSKKIAYDWAISGGSASAQQFTLVLSVPLRHVGKSNRFDQLAIDYFFSIIDMEGIDKRLLKSDICQLKSQLLVILDGLDEYGSYSESPFKLLFEAPFQHSSVNCREQIQMICFKLIITSRPYACERFQTDFPLLRFVILPLDAIHLNNLVHLYCETSHGAAKVTEYLTVKADLVIKVPLILTFVCFLADSTVEIPTNMSSLYDNLIRQMLRREIRQGKLTDSIDIHKWKDADVVKTTGELAFRRMSYFEFTNDALEACHVTNNSFICGFLLHKFDFAKDLLKAEFLHRSIQEFFAALHCYQLMLSGCKDELGDIRNLIRREDDQFGRFLFGICSLEGKFGQMTEWLNPSLGCTPELFCSLADAINQFGTNLLDCSSEENIVIGQRLVESLRRPNGSIFRSIDRHSLRRNLNFSTSQQRSFSEWFLKSLHLVDITRNPSSIGAEWFVADDRQLCRLLVGRPPACKSLIQDCFPFRLAIQPLNTNDLVEVVQLYCQTSEGVAKVTEYLNINTALIIKVPLILAFICYLTDSEDEIPTSMTSLYGKLIGQMISKKNRHGKLEETVDIHRWKDSCVVKSTSELAFKEIRRMKFEFTIDSLKTSHVTKDSFTCGFLLLKMEFANDLPHAEFPHHSIQEFFAALHCYQLMLSGSKEELRDIRKLILWSEGKFGRFLFGIFSEEGKFRQIANWISPSLGYGDNTDNTLWSPTVAINQCGINLFDCSVGENILMGQMLQLSIEHLETTITSDSHMLVPHTHTANLFLRNLSAEFKDSLHLVDLTRDPSGICHDWCVTDAQTARLAVVSSKLTQLLQEKFDRIKILIWTPLVDRTSGMEWNTLFGQTGSLPPVRTIIMSTLSYQSAFTSVLVRIGHGRTTGSELTNFRLDYGREQRKELLKAVQDAKLVKLTEAQRKQKIDSLGNSVILINVTVDNCESQSALISSLIRLSLLSPIRSSGHLCVCL